MKSIFITKSLVLCRELLINFCIFLYIKMWV